MEPSELGRRATIRDVAAAAGVSVKTVSYAVNGKGQVDPATRERVLAAAQQLGYRARRNARSLRAGTSSTIALLLPGLGTTDYEMLSLSYYMRLAGAAAQTAFRLEHGVLLAPNLERGDDLRQLDADGAIICDPAPNDPRIDLFNGIGVPVVTVERDSARPERDSWVAGDNQAATELALDHLADAGAERIALLAADSDWAWTLESIAAYRAWCVGRDVEPIVERAGLRDLQTSAYERSRALLERDDRPDAILAITERHAGGVVQAARELGLRIPDDLLVASGIDSPETAQASLPITALDLHPERRGALAAEIVIEQLAGGGSARTAVVSAELLVRDSTRRGRAG